MKVSAEVILRSPRGSLRSAFPVTSANLDSIMPDPTSVTAATERLRDLGFETIPSATTISIVGPLELFEQVFHASLRCIKRAEDTVIEVEREPEVPDNLRDLVEAVVFPRPPEYF